LVVFIAKKVEEWVVVPPIPNLFFGLTPLGGIVFNWWLGFVYGLWLHRVNFAV